METINSHREQPFKNLRSGGYYDPKRVAQDLVASGQCTSYDEAYAVLATVKSGQIIQTFRGYMQAQ